MSIQDLQEISNLLPAGKSLIDGAIIKAIIGALGEGGINTIAIATANGISGSVVEVDTTATITLVLGAITPTTIVASSTITGSNLSGSNTGDQTIILTGAVTGSGSGSFATTLANSIVTLGNMANLASNSIIGNNTGSAATPIALSTSQVKILLSLNNVENTALSTWAGSANITTVGAINATSIGSSTPCAIQGFCPTNYQTGTSYTLVLGDAGKRVSLTNGSAIALTVPPAVSVAFAAETEIVLRQGGAGTVTVTAGAGVTILSNGSKVALNGQYSYVTLKLSSTANTWDLFGNLA